jgi:hypothetical protein
MAKLEVVLRLIVGYCAIVDVAFDCCDGFWWVATKRLQCKTGEVDDVVAIKGFLEGGDGR